MSKTSSGLFQYIVFYFCCSYCCYLSCIGHKLNYQFVYQTLQRTAADHMLQELQNNPDMWLQVVHVLSNTQNLNTKFFALQVSCKSNLSLSLGQYGILICFNFVNLCQQSTIPSLLPSHYDTSMHDCWSKFYAGWNLINSLLYFQLHLTSKRSIKQQCHQMRLIMYALCIQRDQDHKSSKYLMHISPRPPIRTDAH